jgi:hypothetical protein
MAVLVEEEEEKLFKRIFTFVSSAEGWVVVDESL